MTDIRATSVYLILKRGQYRNDPPKVAGMRISKPSLGSTEVAVKVTLRVDMDWFNEFIPEAIAEVQPESVLTPSVEVEDVPDDGALESDSEAS